MSLYSLDQERDIRLMREVEDWTASGLLTPEQRDQIAPGLQVDLRRTNLFLRITLFLFGFLIVFAVTGLMAVGFDVDEDAVSILAGVASAVTFYTATRLVQGYRLYRFGIEEALSVASVIFAGFALGLLFEPFVGTNDDWLTGLGFAASAAMAVAVFQQFGFVYAAIGAMICAAAVPFSLIDNDPVRRVLSIAILAVVFAVARRLRNQHGAEHPGDTYALVEAAAWAGIYLVTNLKATPWVSHPDEAGPFYWATYLAIWILPAAGLWLAIRARHRALLDASALLAIATLLSNKEYLGATRFAWDPIVFGVLMIGIAIGLRRWLASGADGARSGFVAERLLASEKERLSIASTVSVLQPTVHETHPAAASEPSVGGGRSGGAGASGKF